jgi:hypothetical protein
MSVPRLAAVLYEAVCDDLELRQLVVIVERDNAVLAIHPKRGRHKTKVLVGEDSAKNVRPLNKRR